MATDVEISGQFDAKNKRAWRLAKIAAGKLITNITDETLLAIRVLIMRAIREGIPPHDVARLVLMIIIEPGATTNEQPGMLGLNHIQVQAAMNYRESLINVGHPPATIDKLLSKYVVRKQRERAAMIARTETMWTLNVAAEGQYREAVRQGFLAGGYLRWVVASDEKLCPFCSKLAGRKKPIPTGGEMTYFQHPDGVQVSGPPAHPRCLPGYSLVAPCGRVAASSERWYEGDVVIVSTATGHKLTSTPNHPVLTDRGWVEACALHEGDHVVSLRRGDWEAMIDGEHQNVPARIEDVARSLEQSVAASARRVPVSPEDFHGDGSGSEVAVVRADGLLRDGVDAALAQEASEERLSGGHPTSGLHGHGMAAEAFEGAAGAASRSVGSSKLPSPGLGAHPLPLGPFALTLVAEANAETKEQSPDGRPADRAPGSDGVHGLPGKVALDEVVRVRRAPFAGHVFNLETTTEAYVAEGVIVHNCRCTIVYAETEEEES